MDANLAILWKSYKQNEDLYFRDKLISSYKTFLKSIVNNVYSRLPRTVDIMDLENYAYIGLMDAIKKFELERNIKFETYASYRIKGAIIDGIRKQDWLSRTMRAENLTAGGIEDDHEKFYMYSIDDPNFYEKKAEESSDSLESIYDLYTVNNTNFTEKLENKLFLKKILEKLNKQEKRIVYLYYFKGKTFKEIGRVLNITESRVSQINKQILLSLKRAARSATLAVA